MQKINLIYTEEIQKHNSEPRNTLLMIPLEDMLKVLNIDFIRTSLDDCINRNIKGVLCITSDLCRLHSDTEFESIFDSLINEKILFALKNDFLKLIIFDTSSLRESNSTPLFILRLKNFLLKKNISNNQCSIITNVNDIKFLGYSFINWEFFEAVSYFTNIKNNIDIDLDKKLMTYTSYKKSRFLVLNAKPRFHRYLLMYSFFKKCKNFKNNFNYSLRSISMEDMVWNLKRYQKDIFHMYIDSKKLLPMIPFLKQLPSYIKEEGEISKHLLWSRIDTLESAIYNTGINIVTETTLTTSGRIFLTEKTFRSIAAKMPFIICGQTGVLQKLKHYGYKTFSEFWDESYDMEVCPLKRIDKIATIVSRLSEMSPENFDKLLLDTRSVIEYNYNHFLKNRIPSEICKITNLLYH